MGRIDIRCGQDAVMERRHINQMLQHIDEYEQVKHKRHSAFKTAQEFYDARRLCKQNFLKYYRRYLHHGREISALLPHKTGRKFKEQLAYCPEVIDKLKDLRSKGFNRYDIALLLKKLSDVEISSSTIYRLLCRLKINHLNPVIKEEKRRIIKMSAGELGHIDIHYVAKGTVKNDPDKKFYILGVIDSYSRVCWLEVVDSIKAINVAFAANDIILRLKQRYGIEFKEMMSDNGTEFASRNNAEHPFEKTLSFYGIKHRYTKPFTPKTNGKIERFWKTLEDELLSGEQFENYDDLKHHITGYSVYYNEHRIHQGINNKTPFTLC
jgi:transposase InsO family protein